MTLNKNQLIAIISVAVLVLLLPLAIFMSQKQQEIRSKAADDTTLTPTLTPTNTPIPISPTPSISLTPTPTVIQKSCLTLPQYDTFSDDPQSSGLWDIWNSSGGIVTQDGLGQLKTSIPSGNGYAGVITKNQVCGDFDVSVDFNSFSSSGQAEADARLSVEQQVSNSAVLIERYSNGSGQGFATIMIINGTPTTGPTASSFTTTGKLRIRKIGNVFTTFYDDGSGSWKPLGVFNGGFSSDVQPALIVKSWDQNPSVSANFDNFSLTQAIPDPSLTPIPPTPTLIPSPTPPSGADKYTIDVGNKQLLSINIGPSINPQIRFKAKLGSLRSYPDLYLRMRVRDELATINNPAQSVSDACNNPQPSDKDFYIPMKATDNIYSPVSQNSSTVPTAPGATTAAVSPDGWVTLDGIIPGRYYTLYLKGPKTRKGRMVQHVLLQPNQLSPQDFDWTANPLDPGDLPDPNNNMQQDCVINATDWSLLQSRIGSNDPASLAVCDVNYDGICNAGDSVALLNTLGKRPDDDQ